MKSKKSMINEGWFTSKLQEWETPQDLFNALDSIFQFTLDPCASPINAKCEKYFTKEQDGLKQKWFGRVFVNPPFRDVGKWFEKTIKELRKKNCELVITLTPSRSTEAKYYQEYVLGFAHEIWLLTPRLHYTNPFDESKHRKKHSCVFGSMICLFKQEDRSLEYPIVKGVDWRELVKDHSNQKLTDFLGVESET